MPSGGAAPVRRDRGDSDPGAPGDGTAGVGIGSTALWRRFAACREPAEAELLAGELTRAFGFTFFSYVVAAFPAGDDGRGATGLLLNSYPDEWRTRYRRRSYECDDLVVVDGRRCRAPFGWGSDPQLDAMSPTSRKLFLEARTYGIRDGFTVPVRGPDGDCGLFSVSGPGPGDLAPEVGSPVYGGLLAAAQLLHASIMEPRLQSRRHAPVSLTCHERACLSWTAQGKTAWEIALIIGRSKATVEFHLRRASEKLGATNKVHAVARALRSDLI